MKRFSLLSLAAAAALLLCGCTDISGRVLNTGRFDDDYIPGVGGDLLIVDGDVSSDSEQPGQTQPPLDDYSSYSFSPEQESFIASCLFMGDSICSGLGAYGFSGNCYAKAGVAARNILEFTFDFDGSQVGPLTALVNSSSRNMVFLMGTNDVNMVSAQEYADLYDDFLSKVEAACPGVTIYVLSVTPITKESNFCYNSQLDELNRVLREMIEGSNRSRHYIDCASLLKDSEGNLRETYSAGDNVHLSRSAYYAILYALCTGAGVQ